MSIGLPDEDEPTEVVLDSLDGAAKRFLDELAAAKACVACLAHAKELGHLGEGSTEGWAETALGEWRKITGDDE